MPKNKNRHTSGSSGKQSRKSNEKTCHACGQQGHIRKECPSQMEMYKLPDILAHLQSDNADYTVNGEKKTELDRHLIAPISGLRLMSASDGQANLDFKTGETLATGELKKAFRTAAMAIESVYEKMKEVDARVKAIQDLLEGKQDKEQTQNGSSPAAAENLARIGYKTLLSNAWKSRTTQNWSQFIERFDSLRLAHKDLFENEIHIFLDGLFELDIEPIINTLDINDPLCQKLTIWVDYFNAYQQKLSQWANDIVHQMERDLTSILACPQAFELAWEFHAELYYSCALSRSMKSILDRATRSRGRNEMLKIPQQWDMKLVPLPKGHRTLVESTMLHDYKIFQGEEITHDEALRRTMVKHVNEKPIPEKYMTKKETTELLLPEYWENADYKPTWSGGATPRRSTNHGPPNYLQEYKVESISEDRYAEGEASEIARIFKAINAEKLAKEKAALLAKIKAAEERRSKSNSPTNNLSFATSPTSSSPLARPILKAAGARRATKISNVNAGDEMEIDPAVEAVAQDNVSASDEAAAPMEVDQVVQPAAREEMATSKQATTPMEVDAVASVEATAQMDVDTEQTAPVNAAEAISQIPGLGNWQPTPTPAFASSVPAQDTEIDMPQAAFAGPEVEMPEAHDVTGPSTPDSRKRSRESSEEEDSERKRARLDTTPISEPVSPVEAPTATNTPQQASESVVATPTAQSFSDQRRADHKRLKVERGGRLLNKSTRADGLRSLIRGGVSTPVGAPSTPAAVSMASPTVASPPATVAPQPTTTPLDEVRPDLTVGSMSQQTTALTNSNAELESLLANINSATETQPAPSAGSSDPAQSSNAASPPRGVKRRRDSNGNEEPPAHFLRAPDGRAIAMLHPSNVPAADPPVERARSNVPISSDDELVPAGASSVDTAKPTVYTLRLRSRFLAATKPSMAAHFVPESGALDKPVPKPEGFGDVVSRLFPSMSAHLTPAVGNPERVPGVRYDDVEPEVTAMPPRTVRPLRRRHSIERSLWVAEMRHKYDPQVRRFRVLSDCAASELQGRWAQG